MAENLGVKLEMRLEPPEPGGPKCWALVKMMPLFDDEGFWMLSSKKLTEREIWDLWEVASFKFDLTPYGLDYECQGKLITSCVHFGGTKKAALDMLQKLNEGIDPLTLLENGG